MAIRTLRGTITKRATLTIWCPLTRNTTCRGDVPAPPQAAGRRPSIAWIKKPGLSLAEALQSNNRQKPEEAPVTRAIPFGEGLSGHVLGDWLLEFGTRFAIFPRPAVQQRPHAAVEGRDSKPLGKGAMRTVGPQHVGPPKRGSKTDCRPCEIPTAVKSGDERRIRSRACCGRDSRSKARH
jgi:hypothetical protein